MRRFAWQSVLALFLCIAGAATLPLADAVSALPFTIGQTAAIELLLLGSVIITMSGINRLGGAVLLLFTVHIAAFMLVGGIAGNEGAARPAFFFLLAAAWLLGWRLNGLLSRLKMEGRGGRAFQRFIVPALFGVWILILWEGITRGAGIPFVLLPPPTAIAVRFANSLPILGADLVQTVVKAVLAG